MNVPSFKVVTTLAAAAVISLAGIASLSGPGASAQPTNKPAQPAKPDTQPTKPADPNAKPPAAPQPTPGGERRQERGPGERGPGERGPGGQGGSIDGAMKGMNRALKQLQGQIGDAAKKDDNLKLIGGMERNCVAAKDLPLPPPMLEKGKDDAEKAKISEKYRKNLVTLMRKMLDLEMFVLEGKTDAANAKLLEITKFRDTIHEEMGVKE